MLHAVIMAGGSGTRFWPASRRDTPKQLLRMVGQRSMIQATADRLNGLVPASQQWVVTNRRLVPPIAEQLPEIDVANLIGEPCKRDTAPCIGLAALLLRATDPDATMLVLPSDHLIGPVETFQSAIEAGVRLIDEEPSRIVTFGIRPSYPAESFGYIERGKAIETDSGVAVFEVARFREKPSLEVAEEYLRSGGFDWNSGIFLWRAQTILDALEKYAPEIFSHLCVIGESIGTEHFEEVLDREFEAISGKSIDYAVMEHYAPILVIEAPFQWDDVGSWQAIARIAEADASGNAVQGNHLGIDTSGCIVRTEGNHTIVTIDVHDLVIVQTPDATLVAPKSAEERVREVVAQLEKRGSTELL